MKYNMRYSDDGTEYTLRVYAHHAAAEDHSASLTDRPEWLANIITIADAGGHGLRNKIPKIIWFYVDDNLNLLGFDDARSL